MAECPAAALSDATLPPMARVLLAVLWSYAGREKRFVWPSPSTLADRTGMSPRSVHRNLKVLRDREWVIPAESSHGRPGWHLCDPPGTPVRVAHEAPETGTARDASVAIDDASVRPSDASVTTPASAMTPASEQSDASVRAYSTGTNQEPRGGGYACAREATGRREPDASLPPPPALSRRGPEVSAWSCDFRFAWEAHVAQLGVHISNPAVGASKVVELQRMLDEHGGDVVRDVLLHAASEVARWHESGERHGLAPKMLGVVFRADKPQAFDARLDAWQRDRGRKRVSGRTPVAPAELDGLPLSDEEQRVWVRAQGDDPDGAVRRARAKANEGRDLVGGLLDGLNLLGGAA